MREKNHDTLLRMKSHARIAAVILAAGESRRLGKPKQLLKFRGKTLIERVADMAANAGCDPVIVVIGAQAQAVSDAVADRSAQVVVNGRWREGKGTSIRAGVQSVAEIADASAVVVMSCDQPLVDDTHIAKLISRFHDGGASIVASSYADTLGIPALFARKHFSELLSLNGDEGAKKIIGDHSTSVVTVECPLGSCDIDTPQDYERLQSETMSTKIIDSLGAEL